MTYNNRTVSDVLEVFVACERSMAENWGSKDVGLPRIEMKRPVDRMKRSGKATYLEVVRYSEEECMEAASLAVECGFDYLMETVFHESVNELYSCNPIKYMPFCGRVSGSPSGSLLDSEIQVDRLSAADPIEQ